MKYVLFLSALLTLFASCAGDPKNIMPTSQGTHNEMMVVMNDDLWEGAFGSLVRDRLAKPVEGLPQEEPLFILHQVENSAFGEFFERYKSIVMFNIIEDSTDFRIVRNKWAEPQLIASLIAPDKVSLAKLFEKHKEEIVQYFSEHDARILLKRVKRTAKVTVPDQLHRLGIENMVLPNSFEVTVDKDSLVVLFANNLRTNQVIFVHIRPIDDNVLPGSDLIAVRDSILRYNFEGPSEGSYPGTEKAVPPSLTTTTVDDKIALELRGRWKTYNDFMGGPFLSYSIYDEERNVILTLDSFIYGPNSKKHKLIMEMEVILRSVELMKEAS